MIQSHDQFEKLKRKYQPVLTLIDQLHIRLQTLDMEGPKLLIRGVAPSSDAKNKIWDRIKSIDQLAPDLVCDITLSQSERGTSAATMIAGAAPGGGQEIRYYTVKPGDTLSKISRQFYGDAGQYKRIFDANRKVLRNPDTLDVGQNLIIPE